MDRTQSYSLLVAPKVATCESESQLLVKCEKESVNNLCSSGYGDVSDNRSHDVTKSSKDSRPLSSLTCKMSRSTPVLSSTSLSSHEFVLPKLGDLVSQREACPKSSESRFYSHKGKPSSGRGADREQQGEQRNLKKFKRKATNSEEERANPNNNNNNNMENNDCRDKTLVKEDSSIIVVVSCKDGATFDDYEEGDSRKLKWQKKGTKEEGSVVVNSSDNGIGAKMDVDETDDDADEVKETGEMEMENGYSNAGVVTEVIMANDFDSGTNNTGIEVSENGERTVLVKLIDGREDDKEMDCRKEKNNDDRIEMKADDRDNRFDTGIRDYRSQRKGNGNYEEDSEMTMLEMSASKQEAESNRRRRMKKKMKDDPTRMSTSPPLPAVSKKKKRTTTKTNESMKRSLPLKEMKAASEEGKVLSPHSLGYSLASPDFAAAPSALIHDDDGDVCDAVAVASTEESQYRSPQSGGIPSNESHENRRLNNLSHNPGPQLNTEMIFAPRTKDMDENHYINRNSSNMATIPTSFLSEANNNGNTTTSPHDPAVTDSNGSGGSTTTNVANILIDDLVSPSTTLLIDEQGDSSSTADCE